jgi:RNA polymerase II subunit A small phosphatase-like protein
MGVMESPVRTLLILDLDETLVFASETALSRPADFVAFDYHVYKRPHLEKFLEIVREHFDLAVWSSASDLYVEVVVQNIFPQDIKLHFVWGRSRQLCVEAQMSFDICWMRGITPLLEAAG